MRARCLSDKCARSSSGVSPPAIPREKAGDAWRMARMAEGAKRERILFMFLSMPRSSCLVLSIGIFVFLAREARTRGWANGGWRRTRRGGCRAMTSQCSHLRRVFTDLSGACSHLLIVCIIVVFEPFFLIDGGFDQVPVRGESSRHYFAIEAREVRKGAAG